VIREDPHAVEDLDEVSCEYRRGDELRRRMLAKQVVQNNGGWALVVFLAQTFAKGEWQTPHVVLSRWVRRGGRWHSHTTFNLRHGQATSALAAAAGWEATHRQLASLGIDLAQSLQGVAEGLHGG
jgi:hypothetical protein